jgi:hypothetical protein
MPNPSPVKSLESCPEGQIRKKVCQLRCVKSKNLLSGLSHKLRNAKRRSSHNSTKRSTRYHTPRSSKIGSKEFDKILQDITIMLPKMTKKSSPKKRKSSPKKKLPSPPKNIFEQIQGKPQLRKITPHSKKKNKKSPSPPKTKNIFEQIRGKPQLRKITPPSKKKNKRSPSPPKKTDNMFEQIKEKMKNMRTKISSGEEWN